MRKLNALQKSYSTYDFEEIPENDQILIKDLMKRLSKIKARLVEFEGNANKTFSAFSLEKLSGIMSTQMLQRKFL